MTCEKLTAMIISKADIRYFLDWMPPSNQPLLFKEKLIYL